MVSTRSGAQAVPTIQLTHAELQARITEAVNHALAEAEARRAAEAAARERDEISNNNRRHSERQETEQPPTESRPRTEDSEASNYDDVRRPRPRGPRPCLYKDFMACKPMNFEGTEGPVGLLHWLDDMESNFEVTDTQDVDRVKFAASTLKGDAKTWWKSHKSAVGGATANATPWEDF